MNELLYLFNLICKRRGVSLSKVESVACNWRIAFGLGSFDLLPAIANVFYFLKGLKITNPAGFGGTGVAQFTYTNSGGASAGTLYVAPNSVLVDMGDLETASLTYNVGTHSAGVYGVNCAAVFKVTFV